jgi:hypothetical protein
MFFWVGTWDGTGHGKRGKTGIARSTLFPEKHPLATKTKEK